jgi:MSHA biogenesis protein MshM
VYLAHFGLRAAAFALTPDLAFSFPSRAQSEALDALLRAVDGGAASILLTGAAGTGKTLLCQRLLARLVRPAVCVPNPCLSPQALRSAIAPAGGPDLVVCVDQAQAMSPETFETLRQLTTAASGHDKRFQVVLFGRPELDRILAGPELPSPRERIEVRHELGGLTGAETQAYLAHRLLAAGHRDGALFAPEVAGAIHAYARGVPRVVNIIAHKSLLRAHARGEARVSPDQVRAAAADTPRMHAGRRLVARLRRSDWLPAAST